MGTKPISTDMPLVKDIRAYTQHTDVIVDERIAARYRRTSFLSVMEERWYLAKLEEYRKEFGLRPRTDI